MMRYAQCVKRTTIMLPEDVDARLRREARRRGVSIADVAREAIEHHLPGPADTGRLSFFGVGTGRPFDVSERVDEFVGTAVGRRQRANQSG
jgi:Ribbon-helix-helix protein, copG family